MWTVARYVRRAFQDHPIIANSLAYGTLFVGAELSQQTITKKVMSKAPTAYDTEMLTRVGILGVAVFSPVYYYWYRWLDRTFAGKSARIVGRKLILDQFLLTPTILVIFFVSMSVMENRNDLFEECTKKFVPTFKTSCFFWLPAQTINFFIIPPVFRVVYVGSCSFVWINILCWIKRQEY